MNGCRRYACHRVYDAPNHYLPQSVVSIDGEGKVISIHPLTEETSATEWLGGVIFLSTLPRLNEGGQSPEDFFPTPPDNLPRPLYAWHLSGFDFEHERRTPASILRRL